jgi:nitrate reductase assembly molybdenum cofactor insertion protein NarJ
MTRNELNTYLAIVLETLAEAGDDGAPSGPMYAAMMGHLGEDAFNRYSTIVQVLLKGKLATQSPSHVLTITPAGRAIVAKIEASRGAK